MVSTVSGRLTQAVANQA